VEEQRALFMRLITGAREALSKDVVGDRVALSEFQVPPPLSPCHGICGRKAVVKWERGPLPKDVKVYIGGVLCSQGDEEDGEEHVFSMTKKYRGGPAKVSVRVDIGDERLDYTDAFTWAQEALVLGAYPRFGPLRGGEPFSVALTTAGMDGTITKVHIGGQACALQADEAPTSNSCKVLLPPGREVGAADIQVWADEQTATLAGGFHYFEPTCFERVGSNIELSPCGMSAKRPWGADRAICIGSGPLALVGAGRDTVYYEIIVEEMDELASNDVNDVTGAEALAVGFTTQSSFEAAACPQEAESLSDVWLCGYEQPCAFARARGVSSSAPLAGWRPAQDVHAGTRIGVMAGPGDAGAPELRVVIGGAVQCTLPLGAAVADLRPLVDLRGRVERVSLIQCPELPRLP